MKVLSCAMMELTRGAVTSLDASYSWSHTATGFTIPIPPSLAGRASSALSTSEQGDRPVSAGMNFWNGSEEVGPFVPTSMHKGSMCSLVLTDDNNG